MQKPIPIWDITLPRADKRIHLAAADHNTIPVRVNITTPPKKNQKKSHFSRFFA